MATLLTTGSGRDKAGGEGGDGNDERARPVAPGKSSKRAWTRLGGGRTGDRPRRARGVVDPERERREPRGLEETEKSVIWRAYEGKVVAVDVTVLGRNVLSEEGHVLMEDGGEGDEYVVSEAMVS